MLLALGATWILTTSKFLPPNPSFHKTCLPGVFTLRHEYLKLNQTEPHLWSVPTSTSNQLPFSVKGNSIFRSGLGSKHGLASFFHTSYLAHQQILCGSNFKIYPEFNYFLPPPLSHPGPRLPGLPQWTPHNYPYFCLCPFAFQPSQQQVLPC